MDKPIEITMTSDFICPWCFVAERRLQQAADDEGLDISIRFRPYELNPDMPEDGLNRKTYRSSKFGSWERSVQLDQGTVRAAKDDPLEFDYAAMELTPNTRAAHRLVWYVQRHAPAKEAAIVDAILAGYFSRGVNIGDVNALANIAQEIGFTRAEVVAFLAGDAGSREVAALEREAASSGVRGVPHIQIGDTHLYGAESAGNMRKALREAAATPLNSNPATLQS